MAVLEKIREKTVLVLVMIGLGMFGFLFMGSDQSSVFSCNGQQDNTIGTVNGEEIDIDKYNELYNNLINPQDTIQFKRHSKKQAHEKAWNSLVDEKLISSAASDLGLTVTPEELKELETSTNPKNVSPFFKKFIEDQFRVYKAKFEEQKQKNPDDTTTIEYRFVDINGIFSGEKLENFLLTRSDWPPEQEEAFSSIENKISKERLAEKYQTLIEKGMYTTNSEVITTLSERDQNANVEYVSIPYSSVEDVEVTDEEILEYYNKNISNYKNEEETRNVEFAYFTVTPSSEDITNFHKDEIKIIQKSRNILQKKEIEATYVKASDITDPKLIEIIQKEEGKIIVDSLALGICRIAKFDSIVRADSVKASHILLQIDDRDTITTINDLINFAEDLKKQVENGADFGQLAVQHSKDKNSANKGGDLDWFIEGKMVQEFNDTCFTSEIGELKIVTTQYGVHLIKIDSMTNLIPKYKIAYLDKEVVASEETIDDVRYQAKNFIYLADDQGLVQEAPESKNKLLQYWWLLLDIGIIFLLFYFIYIKKKNVRRFAPYIVLLAILVTVYGIYFDSAEAEDSTILTADNAFKSLAEDENESYDNDENVYNMQFNIKGLANSQDARKIVNWMFDEKTKVRDVSNSVYSCKNDRGQTKFVVVSLSEINLKGNKKLENVRSEIREKIQNNKKFDAISNKLSGSLTLKEASSLFNKKKYIAEGVNFESQKIFSIEDTSQKMESEDKLDIQNFIIEDKLDVQNFVGAVNAMKKGQTRLIKGNNSAYLIYIVIKDSETISEANKAQKAEIQNANLDVVLNAALKTLKDNSDIVDNRIKIY